MYVSKSFYNIEKMRIVLPVNGNQHQTGESEMHELITPAQLAIELGNEVQTLSVWRLHKKGPKYIRVGRLIRYRRSDIEAWLDSQTVKVG